MLIAFCLAVLLLMIYYAAAWIIPVWQLNNVLNALSG